jgi:hypothetical protein
MILQQVDELSQKPTHRRESALPRGSILTQGRQNKITSLFKKEEESNNEIRK